MERHLLFTGAARQDVRELARTDVALARAALRLAKGIASGEVQGVPLRRFGKTGDLGDCRKAYFGRQADDDTHRLVFRVRRDGTVEIVEVLVVAEREGDVAYLLAGLRLGRLDDPVRRADAERSIARTRRRRPSPEKPPGERY